MEHYHILLPFQIVKKCRTSYLDLRDKIQNYPLSKFDEIVLPIREQLLTSVGSKYKQFDLDEELPEEYIFYALQVRTDTVADHAFVDSIDVLFELSRLAEKYKQYIVVKLHPFCDSEALQAAVFFCETQNPYLIVSNGNVITLLSNAKKVIACNSGVSLEALLLDKDVYCFGKSEWFYITSPIYSLSDLKKVFVDISAEIKGDYKKRFLAYLFSEYWVTVNDEKIGERILNMLNNSKPVYDDLYTELSINLLERQGELAEQIKSTRQIERDYQYLEKMLSFFRRKPWLIIPYYLKKRVFRKLRRLQ